MPPETPSQLVSVASSERSRGWKAGQRSNPKPRNSFRRDIPQAEMRRPPIPIQVCGDRRRSIKRPIRFVPDSKHGTGAAEDDKPAGKAEVKFTPLADHDRQNEQTKYGQGKYADGFSHGSSTEGSRPIWKFMNAGETVTNPFPI